MDKTVPQVNAQAVAANWRPLAFCIGAYAVASIMLGVIPIFANLVAERYGLDEAGKGLFSSTEFLAMAVASFLSPLWVRRFSLRSIGVVSSTALAVLYWASALADSYALLLTLRFMAGFASGGLMSCCALLIGRANRPDNNFGWVLVVSVAIAFATSAITPRTVIALGPAAAYLPVAVLMSVLVPFSVWLPRESIGARQPITATVDARGRLGMIALGALWFEAAAASVLVTYLGSIGLSGGLTQVDIGDAIAVASVFGFLGSLFPALLGVKFGRGRTVIAFVALFAVAFALLPVGVGRAQFILGVTVFWIASAALLPYYMTTIALLDPKSILIPILPGVKMTGFTAGPFVASLVITAMGLKSVHVIGLTCLLISTVLVLFAIHRGLRTSESRVPG